MKKRRYAEGGETDSYTPEYDTDTSVAATEAPAPKQMSFKEAFASARKAGDKTFDWNGKKYNTDLAPAKSAGTASSPERKDSLRAKPVYETPYDRMNRENRNEASARSAKLNAERQTLKDNMRKLVESKKLASGGVARGWGMARGARKAKMY